MRKRAELIEDWRNTSMHGPCSVMMSFRRESPAAPSQTARARRSSGDGHIIKLQCQFISDVFLSKRTWTGRT